MFIPASHICILSIFLKQFHARTILSDNSVAFFFSWQKEHSPNDHNKSLSVQQIVVVTEYVEKELYEILGKAGRLSEERAQVIACDLVSALHYLHSKRIVHRYRTQKGEFARNCC